VTLIDGTGYVVSLLDPVNGVRRSLFAHRAVGGVPRARLYKEAYASYTLMASNPAVPGLLKKFYEKADKGRHGVNATSL
jgi:hypothetical protein